MNHTDIMFSIQLVSHPSQIEEAIARFMRRPSDFTGPLSVEDTIVLVYKTFTFHTVPVGLYKDGRILVCKTNHFPENTIFCSIYRSTPESPWQPERHIVTSTDPEGFRALDIEKQLTMLGYA